MQLDQANSPHSEWIECEAVTNTFTKVMLARQPEAHERIEPQEDT